MMNRRVSNRTRKVATKMAAALTSNDNRTQVKLLISESLLFFFLCLWKKKLESSFKNG